MKIGQLTRGGVLYPAAVTAVVGALVFTAAAPAMAAPATPDDSIALAAVAEANPVAIDNAADVAETATAIVDAELGGIDVTLPGAASDGINLIRADGEGSLSLSLPFADTASEAARPAAGAAHRCRGSSSPGRARLKNVPRPPASPAPCATPGEHGVPRNVPSPSAWAFTRNASRFPGFASQAATGPRVTKRGGKSSIAA